MSKRKHKRRHWRRTVKAVGQMLSAATVLVQAVEQMLTAAAVPVRWLCALAALIVVLVVLL